MGIKRENNKFLVITLKHVSGLRIVVNPHGGPKLCAIARENVKNNKFLVITLKHVSGLRAVVNPPGTPKLWAITHENSHNMRNRRVFS